jgi:hypothetical protein
LVIGEYDSIKAKKSKKGPTGEEMCLHHVAKKLGRIMGHLFHLMTFLVDFLSSCSCIS